MESCPQDRQIRAFRGVDEPPPYASDAGHGARRSLSASRSIRNVESRPARQPRSQKAEEERAETDSCGSVGQGGVPPRKAGKNRTMVNPAPGPPWSPYFPRLTSTQSSGSWGHSMGGSEIATQRPQPSTILTATLCGPLPWPTVKSGKQDLATTRLSWPR